MSLCKTCNKKEIRYKLKSAEDVICPFCNHIKHPKNSYELALCSTKCDFLYIWVSKYVSKPADTDVKVYFCLEKDECIKCGKRDFPEVLFVGHRI